MVLCNTGDVVTLQKLEKASQQVAIQTGWKLEPELYFLAGTNNYKDDIHVFKTPITQVPEKLFFQRTSVSSV